MVPVPKTPRTPSLPDWRDWYRLPDEELAQIDIALLNLACAVGLPGWENINAAACLKALDDWAVGVRKVTEHRLKTEFQSNPEKYDYSEPLFRMVKLVLTLQDHCAVRYDTAKIVASPGDPFELHAQFINGAIQGPGGTCATLPVLYAAVGRRLGYPIKLVLAKAHMFCRWDDPVTGERVNIEGSAQGVNTHPDDHYRKWPHPITLDEERDHRFLKSLTPREELAEFVGRRGCQWWWQGNYPRALAAKVAALFVDPTWGYLWDTVRFFAYQWEAKLKVRRPPGFPRVTLLADKQRRRWPSLDWESERYLRLLEAVEKILNNPAYVVQWWHPLRAGRKPLLPVPTTITVDDNKEALCLTQP
jgi:hypothetical protein